MTERTDILTPIGRLVGGDCFRGNDKDANGAPLLIKNGPNAGQPRVDFYTAIAIPKTDPGYAALWSSIHGVARAGFPNLFDAQGNCILPTFAFKITDGDSQIPNTVGNKPCDREGYPGNWVLHFNGGFAPKCYTAGGASIITDPEAIKRGYYVRISGNVASNTNTQKPGVYLNHSMVELIAFGDIIQSGPDAGAVFGGTPAGALPPGASATPPAPSTTPAAPMAPGVAPAAPGVAPAAPMAPAAPGVAPAAPMAPGVAPAAPAMDYLNPEGAGVPTPPPVESFVVDGVGYTREQLTAKGWTPEQIASI